MLRASPIWQDEISHAQPLAHWLYQERQKIQKQDRGQQRQPRHEAGGHHSQLQLQTHVQSMAKFNRALLPASVSSADTMAAFAKQLVRTA